MTRLKPVAALLLAIATVLVGIGTARALRRQGADDYAIISQIMAMKERKAFFRGLTPERKSALWRKHYATELATHAELTSDQRAVVNLAIVMTSPDLFTGNLPNPCTQGSVFATALEKAFPRDTPALRVEIFGQPAPALPKFAHANQSSGEGGNCECNSESVCSSCRCLNCKFGGCIGSTDGCGCWWASSCNAKCYDCLSE